MYRMELPHSQATIFFTATIIIPNLKLYRITKHEENKIKFYLQKLDIRCIFIFKKVNFMYHCIKFIHDIGISATISSK